MNQREKFLKAASGGTETMRDFVKGLLKSVESGDYNHIQGSHYLIKRLDGRIEAGVRSEGIYTTYSWRCLND